MSTSWAGMPAADPEYAGIYLHARYYDPKLGIFLSPDPIGPAGGTNLYGYGLGDPVNGADRSGLNASKCVDPGDSACWPRTNEEVTVEDKLPDDALKAWFKWYFFDRWWRVPTPVTNVPNTTRDEAEEGLDTNTGSSNTDTPTNTDTNDNPESHTTCPAVEFKVTGVAPGQAPGITAITFLPRHEIPDGGVAIKPRNFGVAGTNRNNRPVLASVRLYADWSAVKKPNGLPSDGPYAPHDVVGPARIRNAPGNLMDVYNYQSRRDALASTRTIPIVAVIPKNSLGVKCPQ